jgi:CBS domain-containing protein
MKAENLMKAPVITVAPCTPVGEIAALLRDRRISGVPVTAQGEILGMISEGDLLRRYELGTDEVDTRWWQRLLDGDPAPAAYVRSHARRAEDIMTRPVISVMADTPIEEIVSLFETRRIRRVPVLRDGKLIGIVSRADLVQVLAARARREAARREASDDTIRQCLLTELARQPWWQRSASNVVVANGIVHYWGLLESEEERKAARVAAENVPGVRQVKDHRLRYNSLPSML